jgi:hypothetical protein
LALLLRSATREERFAATPLAFTLTKLFGVTAEEIFSAP